MVGKRTTLNTLQKVPTQIRGGVFTVVGAGGFNEVGINSGRISSYRCAVGNHAIMKGTLVLNVLGANTFIVFTVFDNVAGRLIPVARVDANNSKSEFDIEVNNDLTFICAGDNVANDGSCEVLAYIQEVPI